MKPTEVDPGAIVSSRRHGTKEREGGERRGQERRRVLGWLLLAQLALVAALPAQPRWDGLDTTSFRLQHDATGYRLLRPQGEPIPIPTSWLEPPGVREEEQDLVVGSLYFAPEVTAFEIGAGRLGLHLASYDIQESGSLQAAAGRDVLLILDPTAETLLPGGVELGESRSRGRGDGCFRALFHHLSVGDVDCDRYLDLAVEREQIECRYMDDEAPPRQVYERGPLRWYRQGAEGWTEDRRLDGRLPCAGIVRLPLLAIVRTPVDFVLDSRRGRNPLPPGDPEPFEPPN